jgi:hypothetical protein
VPLASSIQRPAPFRPIVGLIGKKRSGKDTFAARLISDHGFERLAFADALRYSALAADPLIVVEPDEVGPLRDAGFPVGASRLAAEGKPVRLSLIVEAVGWEAAKAVREVRRTLQDFGQGVRLHVDLDVWLRPVIERAKAAPFPVVVTDVRYRNEADAIQAAGGFLVRITRPAPEPSAADALAQHSSEVDLDGRATDYRIDNVGTIAALHLQADELVEQLLRRHGY